MRRRLVQSIGVLTVVLTVLMLATGPVAAQRQAAKDQTLRTPWGHPDLGGIWDRHSITPLERSKEFEGREFFTDDEVARLEKQAALQNTDEARQDDVARDVSTAYNDFWWDRATKVTSTKRTSLVVDPRDGRIPPLTAEAQERAKLESTRPVGSLGTGGRGADGPEDRSLWERCIRRGLLHAIDDDDIDRASS